MNAQRSERGQALVLIILAIVGLFGFLALAVDGGRVYTERRRSQNAADSAALAAAYAANTDADPFDAAWQNAVTNGFDGNGETNTITINNPPIGGPYDGDPEYYQVVIWEKVDPVFTQFVFSGDEGVTSEAVARARPIASLSAGNAVHALSTDSDALEMDGTTGISVEGGNMFSNGGGIKHGSSGKIRVTDGGILISEDDGWTCTGCKSDTVEPIADDDDIEPEYVPDIPEPYCPTQNETIDGVDYYYYPGGISSSKTLQPGIHCIDNGISLTGGDVLKGTGVLLVIKSGEVKIKGNAKIDLKRASSIIDANGHQYGGMLMYIPAGNGSNIALGGTADSWFSGTVYGPSATCDLGGTSQTKALRTAVICYKIKFHGTTDVKIVYKQPENFRLPPMVELSQ